MNISELPDDFALLEISIADESEMDELGQRIAGITEPGMVIALIGSLGAGKTRLARAIAMALGADSQQVNSPTFVLIQRYEARLPVFHFDTYRLRDVDEFAELGPEEYFTANGVCLVEWADRVVELLPDDRLSVEIHSTGPTSRIVCLTAIGTNSRSLLKRLVSQSKDRS